MSVDRIEINSASTKDIMRLRGIGPFLAEQIVHGREADGPFRGPSDLARVPGVSEGLAQALAPQIDWHVAEALPDATEREWWVLAWLAPLAAAFVWAILNSYSSMRDSLAAPDVDGAAIRVWVWASILGLESVALFAFVVFPAAESVSINPGRMHIARVCRAGTTLLFGCGLLSLALSNFVWYEAYAPGGWNDLTSNTLAVGGLIGGIGVFTLLILPLAALIWKPALAQRRSVAIAVDAAFLLNALAVGWITWVFRDEVPLLFLVFLAFQATMLGLIGLLVLTRQMSALELVTSMASAVRSDHVDETNRVMELVNKAFPNPEQQLEVKRALDKTYPASRTRTVGASLVVAIAVAVVGAVTKSFVDALLQGVGVT